MAAPSPLSSRFVPYWTPEIGQRAAELQGRAMRFIAAAGFLVPVSAVVFGTAMNSTNVAYRTIGYVFLAIEVLLLAYGVASMISAARAMSGHFGIKVGVFTGPSFRDDAFQSWKHRHGLDPG